MARNLGASSWILSQSGSLGSAVYCFSALRYLRTESLQPLSPQLSEDKVSSPEFGNRVVKVQCLTGQSNSHLRAFLVCYCHLQSWCQVCRRHRAWHTVGIHLPYVFWFCLFFQNKSFPASFINWLVKSKCSFSYQSQDPTIPPLPLVSNVLWEGR